MEKKSIGEYISALRKVNGLTQKQLAEKLSVTDKAISRWENGDSFPDLSQIPVIAEIFGVTCDEILSGEKRQTNEVENFQTISNRSEKRVKKLLKDTKNDFQNKTFISYGIIAFGMLCVLLCNFAFLKAGLGFLLGCGFFVASVICQFMFSGSSKNKIDEEEMSEEFKELSLFILNTNKKYTHIALCVSLAALPCAGLLENINAGIEFFVFVISSLICIIIGMLINITIVDGIFYRKGVKSGLLDEEELKTRQVKTRLDTRRIFSLIFVVLTILATSMYVIFMEMSTVLFVSPITFEKEQINDFVQYMETPEKRHLSGLDYVDRDAPTELVPEFSVDDDKIDGIIYSKYKNADGEYIPTEELERYKEEIKNSEGNIVAVYYQLNENVSGTTITWQGGELVKIEVMTYNMFLDMRAKCDIAFLVLWVTYGVLSMATLITGIITEKKKVSKIS